MTLQSPSLFMSGSTGRNPDCLVDAELDVRHIRRRIPVYITRESDDPAA